MQLDCVGWYFARNETYVKETACKVVEVGQVDLCNKVYNQGC